MVPIASTRVPPVKFILQEDPKSRSSLATSLVSDSRISLVLSSPCLQCGACCAFYRISFHWSETAPELGGQSPAAFTTPVSPFHVAMKGTTGSRPRCEALEGIVGDCVHCRIYPQRPSPCRNYRFNGENGELNPRCDEARLAFGLPTLQPCSPRPGDEDNSPFPPEVPPIAA